MNICLLGLSGSGKTCYLYTATHVLARGVEVDGHTISATSSDRLQAIRLNRGIEQMASGVWPEGSINTMTYPFEFKIDGKTVFPFTIYDYRGGMLNGLSDADQDDVEEIFDTFEESSCIVILVDGDTVLQAIDPALLTPEHRKDSSFIAQLKARNELNYIESLVKECSERMSRNVPILLAITKSDIFEPEELFVGKELFKELLPSVFSKHNDIVVGVTDVTLGEGLNNNEGKLSGTLCLNTEGNVHLPILFALFQEIDDLDDINTTEVRRLILNIFSSNKIRFYRGGLPAFIM